MSDQSRCGLYLKEEIGHVVDDYKEQFVQHNSYATVFNGIADQ